MSSGPGTARFRPTPGRLVAVVAGIVLLVLMATSTTWYPADQPLPGATEEFSAERWAAENYDSTIVPGIEKDPVDLATLVPLLQDDPDAAGEEYGVREGTSPYTYKVSVTGTAGRAENGLLPLEVDGIGARTRVFVQVGPAINGTALRDATGTVSFNDFVNQVDYADAATALNDLVKSEVLASVDAASLEGTQVRVVGATAPLDPQVVTITPVSLEEG